LNARGSALTAKDGRPILPMALSIEEHRERAAQLIREAFEPLRVG
jgi:hypothetical protein